MPKIPIEPIAIKAPVALAPVSLATRLKPFGIDAANLQLTDLEVAANQTLVLDAADPNLAKQVVQLVPKTIDDIKAWIGVPDAAFAQPPTPTTIVHSVSVLPVHDTYNPDQNATLHTIAQDYVFGHSSTVSPAQLPALNSWIGSIAGSIHFIHYQNIHVAAGARLVVNPSIAILFANNITIDAGGIIQIKCTHGSINCASIQGAHSIIKPSRAASLIQ